MTEFFNNLPPEIFGSIFVFVIILLPLILVINNNDISVFKKVKKYADENGFLYVDKIDFTNIGFYYEDTDLDINMIKEMYRQDKFFDVFKKGEINEYTCGLFKLIDNIEASVFNYNWKPHHYSTGRRAISYGTYIVCILYNKDIAIPEFYMRSSNFADKLLRPFGNLFEEDRVFSNTFTIESPDTAKVKEFLNNKTRNAFLKNNKKNYYYRAKGNCFIVYHSVSFAQYNIDKKTDLLKNSLEIFKSMLEDNTEIC